MLKPGDYSLFVMEHMLKTMGACTLLNLTNYPNDDYVAQRAEPQKLQDSL